MQYDSFESLIGTIIPVIQIFLEVNKSYLCVFEEALAEAQDDFIKQSQNNIFMFNKEAYHYISSTDIKDSNSIKKAVYMAESTSYFVGVLTKNPFELEIHRGSIVDQQVLKKLAADTEKLIVGAYDGEGYLIWEKE